MVLLNHSFAFPLALSKINIKWSNVKRWSKVFRTRAVISITFFSKKAFRVSKQFFRGNPFE